MDKLIWFFIGLGCGIKLTIAILVWELSKGKIRKLLCILFTGDKKCLKR